MHSIEHDGVRIHFNGDFSGDAIICRETADEDGRTDLCVPADALLAFAAEYVRRQRISSLEQTDDKDLLLGNPVSVPQR